MTIHTKSESPGSFSKEHRAHKKHTAREKEQGDRHARKLKMAALGIRV